MNLKSMSWQEWDLSISGDINADSLDHNISFLVVSIYEIIIFMFEFRRDMEVSDLVKKRGARIKNQDAVFGIGFEKCQ